MKVRMSARVSGHEHDSECNECVCVHVRMSSCLSGWGGGGAVGLALGGVGFRVGGGGLRVGGWVAVGGEW